MARLPSLGNAPVLAVGVSGGPDSMALCLLAQDWCRTAGGRVVALTVDHGLRAESTEEARQVHQWLAQQKIEHHILALAEPITQRIQETAREARYQALTEACRKHGALALLLGHHADDQDETVAFRLTSGSGITGLAGISCASTLHGIRLLRPLLSFPKSRLVATADVLGSPYVDDPSNASDRFARNRQRREIAAYPSAKPTLRLLRNMCERERLQQEEAVNRLLVESVFLHPCGWAEMSSETFFNVPEVQAQAALGRVIATVGGREHPPRGTQLSNLLGWLTSSAATTTLGGCLLMKRGRYRRLYIAAEPRPAPPLVMQPARWVLWNGRFSCRVTKTSEASLFVSALDVDDIRRMRKDTDFPAISHPSRLLIGIPALRSLEAILSVPHIDYSHPRWQGRFEAVFSPSRPLVQPLFYSHGRVACG